MSVKLLMCFAVTSRMIAYASLSDVASKLELIAKLMSWP